MKLVWFNFLLTAAFVCGEMCKPGEVNYGSSCYELLPGKMDWDESLKKCSIKGGGLVIPDTLEENTFVWKTFRDKADTYILIGCKYQDGNWVQLGKGDRNCTYYYWDTNEPNFLDTEHCSHMRETYEGTWNNL